MQVITACVPSARICTAISVTFQRFGLQAEAATTVFPGNHSVEHLPSPIEPAEKHYIHIAIKADISVADFLEATFLDIDFISALIYHATTEDDLLTLECLTTASSARCVALAFQAKRAPSQLIKTAKAEGNKPKRRQLAECILGVPSLPGLLLEFADQLIAGPIVSHRSYPEA